MPCFYISNCLIFKTALAVWLSLASWVEAVFFFFLKGWETLFLVLGEEFQIVTGHDHERCAVGLRKISMFSRGSCTWNLVDFQLSTPSCCSQILR